LQRSGDKPCHPRFPVEVAIVKQVCVVVNVVADNVARVFVVVANSEDATM
jgi:hypothetical protein